MYKLLTTLFFMLCFSTIKAENSVVRIDTNDGHSLYLLLDEHPLLMFDDDKVIIKIDGKSDEYEIGNIKSARFDNIATGVTESPNNSVVISNQGDHISIKGLTPGESVHIYTIDGKLIDMHNADNSGNASIGIENNGVYIIKMRNQSVKIKL